MYCDISVITNGMFIMGLWLSVAGARQ